MVGILERYRGVVTQFQGDAILATFNVPVPDVDGPCRQCPARGDRDAVRGEAPRTFAGQRVANRVGINTGRVVAGAVGAKGRLSYTVHGDAVNLAARLEALNKELGTRILVSEATAAQVEGFDLRPRGEVRFWSAARPHRWRSTRWAAQRTDNDGVIGRSVRTSAERTKNDLRALRWRFHTPLYSRCRPVSSLDRAASRP